MLAQSFKPAAELGITEPQRDALCKTLVLLETGKLVHVPEDDLSNARWDEPKFCGLFNMSHSWINADCGTVCCIKGTAELISGVDFCPGKILEGLTVLFYCWGGGDPGTERAATALRSYLTTGDAKWHEAVA